MLRNGTRLDHRQCVVGQIRIGRFDKVPFARNEAVFGKAAVAAGAKIVVVKAHRVVAALTGSALSARNTWEDRAALADEGGIGILADRDDLAAEFVADRQGILLLAGAKFKNTGNVRAADTAGIDLYKNLFAVRFRTRNLDRTEVADFEQACCFHAFPSFP